MNKNRRPQTPKSGNREMAKAMQGLRQSSAAEPHRNKARYSRSADRRMAQKGWA